MRKIRKSVDKRRREGLFFLSFPFPTHRFLFFADCLLVWIAFPERVRVIFRDDFFSFFYISFFFSFLFVFSLSVVP